MVEAKKKKRQVSGNVIYCYVLDPMIPRDPKSKLNLEAKLKQPRKLWHKRFLVRILDIFKYVLLIVILILHVISSIVCIACLTFRECYVNRMCVSNKSSVDVDKPRKYAISCKCCPFANNISIGIVFKRNWTKCKQFQLSDKHDRIC